MITVFGEVMLRISPENKGSRLFNTKLFKIEPGGSESNVAVALSNLGNKTQLVTKLPNNDLRHTILRYLNTYKIGTDFIKYADNRIGMYWTENGVSIRNSKVIYDRENSAFFNTKPDDFRWEEIFSKSFWYHVSGITPALRESLFKIQIDSLDKASKSKQFISFDLNLRKTLWNWIESKKDRKKYYENICAFADMLIGNEEDFFESLDLDNKINKRNYKDLNFGQYEYLLSSLFTRFKKVKYIGISLRSSIDASLNNWQGLFAIRNGSEYKMFKSSVFKVSNIVDRVGAGDSFAAGLIHGINNLKDNMEIVEFAVAFSALKHTIAGDSCDFFTEDVKNILNSNGSGRILR
jgi:2-dehydro-3-deoxygluconokinase